jgi:CBS domain-containing protein
MEKAKILVADPAMTVFEAAKLMAQKKVGAIMIVKENRLVGIFTERDAVFRVVAQDRDSRTTQLQEVMTEDPRSISPDKPFGLALMMMHDNGFRHVPVVRHGRPVGIVSARNALDPALEEFGCEVNRRKQFHSMASRT